ncbi:MAG: multi-sensor signal transduction histidine kinase [Variovorax sp.]|nr:multi-sensor signal transduction histidine kinase [Variovorax sp.]
MNHPEIAQQVWRVVIVDDSFEDRQQVRKLLLSGSDRRYQFVECETGAAGVAAVKGTKGTEASSSPPACVLLDFHLPDINAPEVLAALTGADGMTACPVVVLTGSAGLQTGRSVLRAGAQDYVGKDNLSSAGLTRAVENAIERWTMAQELLLSSLAVSRSERALQTLADHLPDLLIRFDRDLHPVFLNAAVEHATGLVRHAMIDATGPRPWIVDGARAQWGEVLKQTFVDGARGAMEFAFETVMGERHFAATLIPEFGIDGTAEFVLVVLHDITEQKVYEQVLSQAGLRKDEFIAMLGHDLRDPLQTITMVAKLLEHSDSSSRMSERIVASTGRMHRMITQVLDVSRLSSGLGLAMQLQRCDVALLIRDLVGDATLSYPDLPILLDAPSVLEADIDADRLTQVFSNLVGNGRAHGAVGQPICIVLASDATSLRLDVSNVSAPIPQDFVNTMFEPFRQRLAVNRRNPGGMGLGLYIASEIVKAHKGTLAYTYDKERVVFTVFIPLATQQGCGLAPP